MTEDEKGFESLRLMRKLFGEGAYAHMRPTPPGQINIDGFHCKMGWMNENQTKNYQWYGFNWEDCWNRFKVNPPTYSQICEANGMLKNGYWTSINNSTYATSLYRRSIEYIKERIRAICPALETSPRTVGRTVANRDKWYAYSCNGRGVGEGVDEESALLDLERKLLERGELL